MLTFYFACHQNPLSVLRGTENRHGTRGNFYFAVTNPPPLCNLAWDLAPNPVAPGKDRREDAKRRRREEI